MIRTPVHPAIRELVSTHPEPERMLAAIRHANPAELEAIARLWLTEGIPAAFSTCPMEFEHIRALMARDLGISPRAISMTGSARIGYSLSPRKFPRKLHEKSDLDIFIVDSALFDGCMDAAVRWQKDVESGIVTPRNETEARYWRDTFARISSRRRFGFCHPKDILERADYEPVPRIRKTMRRVMRELTSLGQPRKVSARVYRDWRRAFVKIRFDLRNLVEQTVA